MEKRRLFAGVLAVPLLLAGCGGKADMGADGMDGYGSGGISYMDSAGAGDKVMSAERSTGSISAGSDGGSMPSPGKKASAPGESVKPGTADTTADIAPDMADPMDAVENSEKEEESEPEPAECEEWRIPTIEPAAGLLTAGEWNDNGNWGFLVNLVQTGNFDFRAFGIAPYQRVVVHVANGGSPVGHVKAVLYDAQGTELAAGVTDYSGTVYLYYNVYGGTAKADHVVIEAEGALPVVAGLSDAEGSLVTVEPGQVGQVSGQDDPVDDDPDGNGAGSGTTGEMYLLQTAELSVELGEYTAIPKRLDVMFVFDTTGSMGDELMYLQKEFEDIAGRAADQNTRFSVNFYRDEGDDYVVKSNEFLTDVSKVSALINDQYADGGGDYEEAVDLALKDAVLAHEWREDAVKLMFLILDAPPHDTQETAANLKEAVESAARQGIRIIPIASSGVDKKTEAFLRGIAMITGGTYTFLTDDSGIGASHLEPTIGSYTVEALNDLIVRLIKQYYE